MSMGRPAAARLHRYMTRQLVAREREQSREAGRGFIESAVAVRAAEIDRLDDELRNLQTRATAGDHAALARILDLSRQRAALAAISNRPAFRT